MNLLEGLNDKQKEAVMATEGPCLVIAGAGCSAGLAYLDGGKEEEIVHAIVNTLGIISSNFQPNP